jgi:hypothetical protein
MPYGAFLKKGKGIFRKSGSKAPAGSMIKKKGGLSEDRQEELRLFSFDNHKKHGYYLAIYGGNSYLLDPLGGFVKL